MHPVRIPHVWTRKISEPFEPFKNTKDGLPCQIQLTVECVIFFPVVQAHPRHHPSTIYDISLGLVVESNDKLSISSLMPAIATADLGKVAIVLVRIWGVATGPSYLGLAYPLGGLRPSKMVPGTLSLS